MSADLIALEAGFTERRLDLCNSAADSGTPCIRSTSGLAIWCVNK